MKRKWNRRDVLVRASIAALFIIGAALAALILARRDRTTEPAAESAPPSAGEPSAEPAPSAKPDLDAQARMLLERMTLREKICQLLIVEPDYLSARTAPNTAMTDELSGALEEYPVGGMLLMLQNIQDAEQLKALTAALQDVSAVPMILCVDEEGGDVARLMEKVGTTKLKNMYTYRSGGVSVARANGRTLGRDLLRFGINTDLAPVADVWSNPDNKVIGERAYSDDFGEAAKLVAAAVRGFHDSGVICCLKHFPGHGSTRTDSHKEAAIVDATLDELRENELLPFQSGIQAGADMVMVGHLTVPDLDSQIATFSHRIVTELLRQELGFDGVIVTDGLEMLAAGSEPDGKKALRALQAGCDLLLGLHDIPAVVQTVEDAVASGAISEEELDEHVLRVLRLKLQYGLIEP